MGKARVIDRVILLAKPYVQSCPRRFRRIAADILPVEGFDGAEVAFALAEPVRAELVLADGPVTWSR